MDITWNCPSCGQELSADDSAIGQEIECPTCAAAQVIPEPRSTPDLSMLRSASSESSLVETGAPPPSLMEAVTLAQEPIAAPPSLAAEPPRFALPIPMPSQGKPAQTPAAPTPGAPAGAPAEAPAEPKRDSRHEPHHYVVPQHEGLAERFVKKKAEAAAPEGPKVLKMRVRAIKRNLCEEVGHDKFEEVVTAFLNKIGEENIISVTPVGYAYVNTLGQNLADYGVLIVYRG